MLRPSRNKKISVARQEKVRSSISSVAVVGFRNHEFDSFLGGAKLTRKEEQCGVLCYYNAFINKKALDLRTTYLHATRSPPKK